jgi:hypothetical protein
VVIAVGLVLGAATLMRAWGDTLDDAFITFRSVHNFALGRGLTFNPARPSVESFSNPLLAILLAPFAALGVPLPWVARALGLMGIAAAAWSAGRMAQRASASDLGRAVVLATIVGSSALVYYAATGLETALLSGLLLLALERTTREGVLDRLSTVLWIAVAISRPEAPLVVLLALTSLRRPLLRASWLGLVAIGAALLVLVLGRIAYFGDIVPNTFHAKAIGSADHDPSSSPLLAGPRYLLHFALACGLVLPLGALAAIREAPRSRVMLGSLAALGGGVIFALYAGGDWMPMGRYLVPYVPLVALTGVLGIESLVARGQLTRPRLALGLAALAGFLGSADALSELWIHQREYPYHVMSSRDSLAAIEAMHAHLPAGSRVVAFRIGALGDIGDYEVIDLLGLTDRRIAAIASSTPGYHPQRSRMGDDVPALREYVASQDPDAVLLVTYADGELDPSITLYDLSFRFADAYPIGADQRWVLYLRERD